MSFIPTEAQLAAVLEHAGKDQPLEACGVVADGTYFPVRNEATEHDAFSMDMRAFHALASEHRIEAVVHSHVYLPPLPSDGDRAACERTGLPFLIVAWPTGKWTVIEPSGWKAPLVGRQWAWGTQDCYAIVRDGFLEYAGLELPDFERDWLWWKKGGDIIREHFGRAGFRELPSDSQPRHLDVFAMRVNSEVVNHLGLFLAPDAMLHQVMGQLSRRVVYGGVWRQATELHLRHESLSP